MDRLKYSIFQVACCMVRYIKCFVRCVPCNEGVLVIGGRALLILKPCTLDGVVVLAVQEDGWALNMVRTLLISCHCWESKHDSSGVQPIPSHYTDYRLPCDFQSNMNLICSQRGTDNLASWILPKFAVDSHHNTQQKQIRFQITLVLHFRKCALRHISDTNIQS